MYGGEINYKIIAISLGEWHYVLVYFIDLTYSSQSSEGHRKKEL